jgi:Family of unknown function (DUF5706)
MSTSDSNDQHVEQRLLYKESLLAETREELQKADNKASILLATSGFVLAALLTVVTAHSWKFSEFHHSEAKFSAWAAIFLALVGFLLIAVAVKPRHRSDDTKKEALHYFGDVEAFRPKWCRRKGRESLLGDARGQFDSALIVASTLTNHEKRLDDQIWVLGHIVYRKYWLVSGGMWFFAGAIFLGVLALLLERA